MENRPEEQRLRYCAKSKKFLFVAVGVSLVLTVSLTALLFHRNYWAEAFLGWGLATGFNLLGLAIRLSAIGKNVNRFFAYAFVLGALNAVVFLVLVFLAIVKINFNAEIFVSAIFMAYFSLLIYNIWQLKNMESTVKPATL